jgi:uncharacterized repeat protein (TIGR01451 family)
MRFFQKTTYIAIISAIICAGSFLFASSIKAEDTDISVIFTPNPLFQEANFLPGSSVHGSAQVTNTSGAEKPIAIEAINITNDEIGENEYFGDALDLAIKEDTTEIYSGTLTEFFNAGEIYLTNLATEATTTYDLAITFNETSENKHQGKNLGFDILIGFQGVEGGVPSDDGGGILPSGLTIKYEKPFSIGTTTTLITWNTSYFSTSQVIYDTVPGKFDLNAGPQYGYANSKEGDDSGEEKVTAHRVTLTGLSPSTVYYYRTVSHASPPTISRERSFTTLASSQHVEDIEKDIEEVEVLGEEAMPVLKIEKNFESKVANPGDIIKYQIEITNDGNFNALEVVISEKLTEGLVFESNNQREQIFTLGNIKPNETKKMSYAVIIDKNIAPGIYLSSTKLSALNHDTVETKASFEIRGVEQSSDAKPSDVEIEDTSGAPVSPGDLIITPEQETEEESREEDEEIEKLRNKEIEDNDEGKDEEMEKSNIKEWLLWVLLLIIAIEIYILINKKKKRKDE